MLFDIVTFGEVLWDVIDGAAHIGGAPFNLAAHGVRCGMRAAVISAVGDDDLGDGALRELARLGVDARWVARNALPTGTVTVTLDRGEPTYQIHQPVAWDAIPMPAAPETARAFCFGTLAQRAEASCATLARLLADTFKDALKFFDVNLRQDFWSQAQVEAGIASADIIKVNEDEAAVLNGAALASVLREKVVIVTLGAQGCAVYDRSWPSAPVRFPSPRIRLADAVGAGDAFAAAFLAETLNGKSPAEAAAAGNMRGAWVASQHGAIPDKEQPPLTNHSSLLTNH
ncbi:MAG: PfkB family carbohydrate kinase [Kiritimatiellaeota bacterium]|nr:PfkB family carbohydrate kinase [Kiritimatiellota bacterium]